MHASRGADPQPQAARGIVSPGPRRRQSVLKHVDLTHSDHASSSQPVAIPADFLGVTCRRWAKLDVKGAPPNVGGRDLPPHDRRRSRGKTEIAVVPLPDLARAARCGELRQLCADAGPAARTATARRAKGASLLRRLRLREGIRILLMSCCASCCRRTSTSCLMSTLRLISMGLSGGLTVMQLVSGKSQQRAGDERHESVFVLGHSRLVGLW